MSSFSLSTSTLSENAHAPYILAAYALSFIVISLLVHQGLRRLKRAQTRLNRIEQQERGKINLPPSGSVPRNHP